MGQEDASPHVLIIHRAVRLWNFVALCGHEEKNQHEIKFSQKILMAQFSQLWMWKTG